MRDRRERWSNRDRLHSQSSRSLARPAGSRRIISLVLLLVLILLCMNQLSDPRRYGPLFRAIGLASEEAPEASSRTSQGVPVEWLESSEDQIAHDLADVWQSLLQELSADQQSSISQKYFKKGTSPGGQGEMSQEQVDRNISDAWRVVDAQVDRWQESKGGIATAFKIHTFIHRWNKLRQGPAPNTLEGELLSALGKALEQKASRGLSK